MNNDDLMRLAEGLSETAEQEARYAPTTGEAFDTALSGGFTALEDLGMQVLNLGPAQVGEDYSLRDKASDTGQILSEVFNMTRFGDGSEYESPYDEASMMDRFFAGIPDPTDVVRLLPKIGPELGALALRLPERFKKIMEDVTNKEFLTNVVFHGTNRTEPAVTGTRNIPNAKPFNPENYRSLRDAFYGFGMYHSGSLSDAAGYASGVVSDKNLPVVRADFLLGNPRFGNEILTRQETAEVLEEYVNLLDAAGLRRRPNNVDMIVNTAMEASAPYMRRSGRQAIGRGGPRIERESIDKYPPLPELPNRNQTTLHDVIQVMTDYGFDASMYSRAGNARQTIAEATSDALGADYFVATNAINPTAFSLADTSPTETITYRPGETVVSAVDPSEWASWFRRNAPNALNTEDMNALRQLGEQFFTARRGNVTPERAEAAVLGYPLIDTDPFTGAEQMFNQGQDPFSSMTAREAIMSRSSVEDLAMNQSLDELVNRYFDGDNLR